MVLIFGILTLFANFFCFIFLSEKTNVTYFILSEWPLAEFEGVWRRMWGVLPESLFLQDVFSRHCLVLIVILFWDLREYFFHKSMTEVLEIGCWWFFSKEFHREEWSCFFVVWKFDFLKKLIFLWNCPHYSFSQVYCIFLEFVVFVNMFSLGVESKKIVE
jgi:hypothetical protein